MHFHHFHDRNWFLYKQTDLSAECEDRFHDITISGN